MNRSILPLTLLLPVFAAATANAQLSTVRFAAPVNPIASLPKLLPSPMVGPLAGTGITLPSLVPALTPSIVLAAATPDFILPMRMPSRDNTLPAKPTKPSRDGVNNPLRRVIPGVIIRFDSVALPAAKPDASKERLDQEFDGQGAPPKPIVGLPRRGAVSSGRHITLPEWDLERELGI
ncbi:MAG: hypothetical protein ACHQ2Z_07425 [Elusimicrobiota bacterium]